MYNRYIPQPDGSYRRNRMPDPALHPGNQPIRREPQAPRPTPPCPEVPPPQSSCIPPRQPKPHPQKPCGAPQKDAGIGSFLRQLLPKGIDTDDLLIILLLLLMTGDCAEDQNTALLTLAIYLFL